jgi:cytochrome P450
VASEGELWKEHRRFALRTLRDFGLGRNQSEEIIQTEIHQLLELLDKEIKNGNHRINIMDYLLRSVSNVICTLTMGEQPCYENDEVLAMIHKFRENLSQNIFTLPVLMFPSLFKYLAPLFLIFPKTRSILKTLRGIVAFLQVKIEQHETVFDSSEESGDYIEAYLREKQKRDSSTTTVGHTFIAKQLKGEIFDLFLAGTDTTSNSLSWGLLYLAIDPDIQMKCHAEINATIGREKQPTMKDKEQMPYMQAVLDEIQRYATIVPMGVTHRNFQSDTIHGYHIEADTLIVPFQYGIHHDPRVWEKPEQFYPEHFLTTDLDGKMKYKPRQELIPFSLGKRECLGESLAKMELFLFFVSILQKYEVHLPEMRESELTEVLLGTEGPIHSPGHHELLFHPY